MKENSSQNYIPAVGEECLAIWSVDEYKKVKVIAHDSGKVVFRWQEAYCNVEELDTEPYRWANGSPTFKPLPKEPTMKELVIEKWRRQGLNYAYDDVDTDVELGYAIDFILANYRIEEK